MLKHSPDRHLEDLRISPRPILLLLACISYGVLLVRSLNIWFFVFILLLPVLWIIYPKVPNLSRSITIGLVIVLIFIFSQNLDLPALFILLVIPTILGAAMFPMAAGFGIALMMSAILAVVKIIMGVWLPWDVFWITQGMNWTIIGIIYLIYRPIYQHYHWLDEYAQSSQKYMHEAQSRMVELNYALFSLANANRQLKAVTERMDALRAIAEDAEKTKTMFLSKVSHEFRTPLNMIIGLVELMAKNPEIYSMEVPPEMENDLRVIQRNCQHLSGMINDVLDLTRVETGQVALHKEWTQLKDLFDETTIAVKPLVEKKSLELLIDIEQNLPAVYCDRTRIRQVIFNLVSNAARFTEKGFIHINARTVYGKVEVSVEDTGPGILPEDLEHIFEPFFQGSRDLWRGREGSGLGLSISQQFINLHDGRLWVESEFGKGSRFYFELPISQEFEYLQSAGQWIREDWVWREEAFKAGKLSVEQLPNKPRVMIYDQTEGLSSDLNRFEEQIDMVRIKEISRTSEETLNLSADVLMINAAREEDLIELATRARLTFPALPVIGCAVTRREHRALEMGAAGYLIKPISSQSLESVIRNAGHPVQQILIIDDDPEIQHLFQRMLWVIDKSLLVEPALNAFQAFEKLAGGKFDLILLDIILPDLDGWQLLKQIRQDDRYHDIPIFIVTAQDPVERPPSSDFFLATISQGISLGKIFHGTLEFSKLLLKPESKLDTTAEQ